MTDRVWVQRRLRELYLGLTSTSGQLSLAIPPRLGAMSTGQRAVMFCGWGVKAGTARVWWQVKLRDPKSSKLSHTRHRAFGLELIPVCRQSARR